MLIPNSSCWLEQGHDGTNLWHIRRTLEAGKTTSSCIRQKALTACDALVVVVLRVVGGVAPLMWCCCRITVKKVYSKRDSLNNLQSIEFSLFTLKSSITQLWIPIKGHVRKILTSKLELFQLHVLFLSPYISVGLLQFSQLAYITNNGFQCTKS